MGLQYNTPLACASCKNQVFETEEPIETAIDLSGATCTKCRQALTEHDILTQLKTISDDAVTRMLEDAAELQRQYRKN